MTSGRGDNSNMMLEAGEQVDEQPWYQVLLSGKLQQESLHSAGIPLGQRAYLAGGLGSCFMTALIAAATDLPGDAHSMCEVEPGTCSPAYLPKTREEEDPNNKQAINNLEAVGCGAGPLLPCGRGGWRIPPRAQGLTSGLPSRARLGGAGRGVATVLGSTLGALTPIHYWHEGSLRAPRPPLHPTPPLPALPPSTAAPSSWAEPEPMGTSGAVLPHHHEPHQPLSVLVSWGHWNKAPQTGVLSRS
ncbi:uncharacterized protein LOC126950873 [Macaca thibetana thibetana]|uniref:uncharacterized protein LOC126950873 n=1 Tax=Macaca thibetana thibetana TaxID=257877 RepID=UPI0021BCD0C3|nr:uncharacterized protein LOC126950873 [Macaca thibetana thibetana]